MTAVRTSQRLSEADAAVGVEEVLSPRDRVDILAHEDPLRVASAARPVDEAALVHAPGININSVKQSMRSMLNNFLLFV